MNNRFDLIAHIEQNFNRSQTTGLACLIFLAAREKTTVLNQCLEWGFTQIDEQTVNQCDALTQDDLFSLGADIAASLLEEILVESNFEEPQMPICPMTAAGVDPFETEFPQISTYIPFQ